MPISSRAVRLISPKIVEHSPPFTVKAADSYLHITMLCDTPLPSATLPYGDVIAQRLRARKKKLSGDSVFITDLPNARGTRVSLACVPQDSDAFSLLTLARKLIAPHAGERVALVCAIADRALAARAAEAVVAAALAAAGQPPSYRSRPEPASILKEIHVYAAAAPDRYRRTRAEALGNQLARHLTGLPANALTPARYRQQLRQLARRYGWRMQFLDTKKLQALGAGAFLAVTQGSPNRDAGIVRLRYTPARSKKKTLALVGKGICFDTGGVNLKTAKGMYGMHEDMEGSAVALGTLLALTELRVDFPVECWLALAENHIGPNAYKPNDVVTAANGTTIEIVHTDAEGRMVLADTLYFAARERPALIIDYATLTGTCVQALGTRYSGATANQSALVEKIIAAGKASGERVWPFPLDSDYGDDLKSDIADIKQCTVGGEADQILAPLFLRRFVDDAIPWIHIDLAAGNHKGGLAHIPTDVTGFGVRFSLNLLFDQKPVSF